jgi:hypothetical protein
MHGKLSKISNKGKGVFKGLPKTFEVTRYHSLIVERRACPNASPSRPRRPQSGKHIVMGLQHKTHPVHGVQFHPRASPPSTATRCSPTSSTLPAWPAPPQRARRSPRRLRAETMDAPALPGTAPADPEGLRRATLSEDEIRFALDQMTAGAATPAQMGAFLMALQRCAARPVEEIAGAAQMLRAKMNRWRWRRRHRHRRHRRRHARHLQYLDLRGADRGRRRREGSPSTATAASPPSRAPPTCSPSSASSSRCRQPTIARCVGEAGVGLPVGAAAPPRRCKHWAPIRGELGIRTIFNLLGPICNPAGVKRQVGRRVLLALGGAHRPRLEQPRRQHVWVVHGHDGLDELTTTGPPTSPSSRTAKSRCSR